MIWFQVLVDVGCRAIERSHCREHYSCGSYIWPTLDAREAEERSLLRWAGPCRHQVHPPRVNEALLTRDPWRIYQSRMWNVSTAPPDGIGHREDTLSPARLENVFLVRTLRTLPVTALCSEFHSLTHLIGYVSLSRLYSLAGIDRDSSFMFATREYRTV